MPECTAATLTDLSKCLCGMTPQQLEWAKTYLLAVAAGETPTAANLAELSKCLCGLTPLQLKQSQTMSLCQIANAEPPPPGETDGLIWGPSPETVAQFDGNADSYLSLINSSTGETYTTLSIGNPTHVVGAVSWNGYTGTSLTFRLLETVGANLSVNGTGTSSLDTLIFESLVSVATDADLGDNPSLVTLNLDQLVSVGGQLYVDNNTVQTTLSLPALTSVDSISINGSAPILSAPVLPTYPPSGITADGSLLTLNLPAVTDDGAGLLNSDLVAMTGLVTLNLNALTAVTADFDLSNNDPLTSLNISSLQTIGGQLVIDTTSLPSLSAPSLTSVATFLSSSGVTTIVTASFPALATVGNDVLFAGCTSLTSFSAPLWVPTDGTTIDFNGDALDIPSVELILRRLVLAGVVACTIDLSGGTNAGTASLSAQGQADVATLGAQVTMNP